MSCPDTEKTWNKTKCFLKSIVTIHTDLTSWWYLLHLTAAVFSVELNVNFMWKPEPTSAKRLPCPFWGMAQWFQCESPAPPAQSVVQINTYRGVVWKAGSWLEARKNFSCPPPVEQKPSFNLFFLCSTAFFKGHVQVVSGSQCFS